MKKTLFIMAAGVMLAGCIQEDLLGGLPENHGGVVGVNTFVSSGTKGTAFDDATAFEATENGFDLFAYESDGSLFMDGVEFQYLEGIWDYADKGEIKFWQQVGSNDEGRNTVNFYAVSPANVANVPGSDDENGIGYDSQTIAYTVADNSADQVDLMYAKTTEVDPEGEAVKNGVSIKFDHALSQILFRAEVLDEVTDYLHAEVNEVEIVNLYNTGTFSFEGAAFGDYDPDSEYTPWTVDESVGKVSYDAQVGWDGTENSTVSVNPELDGTDADLTTSESALILLPQEITGAELTDNKTAPGAEETDTYIRVNCKVYYKGTNDNEATTIVGSEEEFEDIYIPLNTTWLAGYKYVYTLVFSHNIADPVTIREVEVGEWQTGNRLCLPENEENEEPVGELTYNLERQAFEISRGAELAKMRDLINGGAAYTLDSEGNVTTVPQTAAMTKSGEEEGETGEEEPVLYYSKANYILTRDIDLSNYSPWEPIGMTPYSEDVYFNNATFDGNGKTVSNVTLESGQTDGESTIISGLFSIIQNVTVCNLTVTGETEIDDNAKLIVSGGIVGLPSMSTLYDCHYMGDITLNSLECVAGGIMGFGAAEVISCSYNGDITCSTSVTEQSAQLGCVPGGIAGLLPADSKLYGNFSRGAISADGFFVATGGIVGGTSSGPSDIKGNYTTMSLTSANTADGQNHVGTVVGAVTDDSNISGNAYAVIEGINAIGYTKDNFAGTIENNFAASDEADAQTGAIAWYDAENVNNAMNHLNNSLYEVFVADVSVPTYTCSFVYNDAYDTDKTAAPLLTEEGEPEYTGIPRDSYVKVAGSNGTPTLYVATRADLANMQYNIENGYSFNFNGASYSYADVDYLQTADIDLTSYGNWEPIGTESNPFKGTYSVQKKGDTEDYYTINGLTITDCANEYAALFGRLAVESGIKVCNIRMTDVNINVSDKSAAGIAGYAGNAEISNCTVSGSISGKNAAGIAYLAANSEYIGCVNEAAITAISGNASGIVGSTNHSVTNCTNSGKVTATSYAAGITVYSSNVYNSSNSGHISTTGMKAGGIIANSSNIATTIHACWNTGTVSATHSSSVCGGIVASITNKPEIIACYNVASVTGTTAGGIAGSLNLSKNNWSDSHKQTIIACYSINPEASNTTGGGGIIGEIQEAETSTSYSFNIHHNYCQNYDSAIKTKSNEIGLTEGSDVDIYQETSHEWFAVAKTVDKKNVQTLMNQALTDNVSSFDWKYEANPAFGGETDDQRPLIIVENN